MDKKQLNNEIILCRPAVRKAKVAVIRKILKKMKILKSCKLEGVKEKKLKKAERMFEKVQIMKKVKLDDVTKFALMKTNLETFIKSPTVDLKDKALACLARHDAVMQKVASIKEQIPNLETELPILLDSLGKNKIKMNKKNQSIKIRSEGGDQIKQVNSEIKKVKVNKGGQQKKSTKGIQIKSEERRTLSRKIDESGSGTPETLPVLCETVKKIEKIDDPFFIEKKVIAPKLILENLDKVNDNKINKRGKAFLNRETPDSTFQRKPFDLKRDFNKFNAREPTFHTEEKLHPSWAAKKIKLIKPFQGKKIKFTDE